MSVNIFSTISLRGLVRAHFDSTIVSCYDYHTEKHSVKQRIDRFSPLSTAQGTQRGALLFVHQTNKPVSRAAETSTQLA